MPSYYFAEIWTPFKLAGIRFFKDDQGGVWVKFWGKKRRRIRIREEAVDRRGD